MTKYDTDSTHWKVYPFNEMSWKDLKQVSNAGHNMLTFEASYMTFDELWQDNGTFSIQVY